MHRESTNLEMQCQQNAANTRADQLNHYVYKINRHCDCVSDCQILSLEKRPHELLQPKQLAARHIQFAGVPMWSRAGAGILPRALGDCPRSLEAA